MFACFNVNFEIWDISDGDLFAMENTELEIVSVGLQRFFCDRNVFLIIIFCVMLNRVAENKMSHRTKCNS